MKTLRTVIVSLSFLVATEAKPQKVNFDQLVMRHNAGETLTDPEAHAVLSKDLAYTLLYRSFPEQAKLLRRTLQGLAGTEIGSPDYFEAFELANSIIFEENQSYLWHSRNTTLVFLLGTYADIYDLAAETDEQCMAFLQGSFDELFDPSRKEHNSYLNSLIRNLFIELVDAWAEGRDAVTHRQPLTEEQLKNLSKEMNSRAKTAQDVFDLQTAALSTTPNKAACSEIALTIRLIKSNPFDGADSLRAELAVALASS